MKEMDDLLELGFRFHGHRCPAMPLGIRSALAAMRALGVERSQDKELHLISETGKGHAGGCFADGLMVATGCTYGKANIEKSYRYKFAFTLIDVEHGKAVRVSLKPEYVEKMLNSPFVKLRSQGKKPQEIEPEVLQPLLERVLTMPEEDFLTISAVADWKFDKKKGVFEAQPCDECGEMTFVHKLVEKNGNLYCIDCAGKTE